jgi:hypothetical protein
VLSKGTNSSFKQAHALLMAGGSNDISELQAETNRGPLKGKCGEE